MNIDEKIIQLLDGDIDDKSVLELKKAIESNPELIQEKELYQQIILTIQKRGEVALRKELDGFLEEHLENQKDSKIEPFNRRIFYGGIAASFLLVLSFFYFTDNGDKSIPLQINKAPIHADSATLRIDSLKNIDDSVKVMEK